MVKTEFEKIQAQFFNHFKRKVNNYKIEVSYREDKKLIKKQETKEHFEKYVEINPVLKDLDELMQVRFKLKFHFMIRLLDLHKGEENKTKSSRKRKR